MIVKNEHQIYEIIGDIRKNNILIIGDHASNIIPADIDLGIDESLLNDHIAVDIGVKTVSEMMVKNLGIAAILAAQSRLVIDLNRREDDPSLIPLESDGIYISGNDIDEDQKQERISRFHKPYHDKVAQIIAKYPPSIIIALHSFTPILRTDPNLDRPWDAGVMYGPTETASKLAIEHLLSYGLMVGDQLPYTGKIWNATMDRHTEPRNIPYFGLEMRQDLVADHAGCERFAQILGDICVKITKTLASH